jgi:hypothetical protein
MNISYLIVIDHLTGIKNDNYAVLTQYQKPWRHQFLLQPHEGEPYRLAMQYTREFPPCIL